MNELIDAKNWNPLYKFGGLTAFLLAWNILVARRLFQLGRSESK